MQGELSAPFRSMLIPSLTDYFPPQFLRGSEKMRKVGQAEISPLASHEIQFFHTFSVKEVAPYDSIQSVLSQDGIPQIHFIKNLTNL